MVLKRTVGYKKIKPDKYWTVKEAAQLLNKRFEGRITEADIFEFAWDGRLKMSVEILKKTFAVISTEHSESEGASAGKSTDDTSLIDDLLERYSAGISDNERLPIDGYFNLPMKGGEALGVKYELQKLKGSSPEKQGNLGGTFVEREGTIFQLQEHPRHEYPELFPFDKSKNYIPDTWRPAACLPKEIRFLVHSRALNDFLGEELYSDSIKEVTGKEKGPPREEKIKKDTVKLKKQNIAKEPNKKVGKSNQSIVNEDIESFKPALDDEGLPLKRQDVSEKGFLRLEQIIGNPEKGIEPIIPVSRSTWYARVKEKKYPQSYPLLSGRIVGWKKSEIVDLLERMKKGEV